MPVNVIVGTQWGDEGKGKITDLLARDVDMVVRYQGGNNAGHTVVIGDDTFKLHLIPSGIFYPKVQCVIGNGVVVDPKVLIGEVKSLKKNGFSIKNFFISSQAHVIFPYHRSMDAAQEKKREAGRIGTTCRGIGPCYVDKYNRRGVRVGDLFNKKVLRERVEWNVTEKAFLIKNFYKMDVDFDADSIIKEYEAYAKEIESNVIYDSSLFIDKAVAAGKNVLLEGAQGTMLDVDHGTYPFVTSSNPISGGACSGAGIGPTKIKKVIGVVKAYVTRVGEGPFPTEVIGGVGDHLREKGSEYGATTGRPRRCGWFDAVVMRHATRTNGLTDLAITKLDVLGELETIKICTKYKYKGKEIDEFPTDIHELGKCEPVYEEMPGWKSDIAGISKLKDLPKNAQKYVERLSKLAGAKATLISTGPERDETIRL